MHWWMGIIISMIVGKSLWVWSAQSMYFSTNLEKVTWRIGSANGAKADAPITAWKQFLAYSDKEFFLY